jgi:hypothetical protein
MHVEPSLDVVEDASYSPLTRHKDGLAVVGVAIDVLNNLRTHKEWILAVLYFVLVVPLARFDVCHIPDLVLRHTVCAFHFAAEKKDIRPLLVRPEVKEQIS